MLRSAPRRNEVLSIVQQSTAFGSSSIHTARRLTLPGIRLRPLSLGAYLFWCAFAIYLAAGWYLVFEMHLIVGDALSRVGNAYYVLFSRDPHLAAIGFVWGPLPSILMLPVVALGGLWRPLVADGFAANLLSAVFMAAAVQQMFGLLTDLRITRGYAAFLAFVFALHPMIIQYGANGDSEALFLLLLVAVARNLRRWMFTHEMGALVAAALLLGLAYLTRYEALAAMAAVGGVVLITTLQQSSRSARRRLMDAGADLLIVALPGFVAVIGWAAASWLIVGTPFEQFTSVYGTTAQLAAGAVDTAANSARAELVIGQVTGLMPSIVGVLLLGLLAMAVVRRFDLVAAPAVLASVLMFAVGAWLLGKTGGWLRYYIAVVPLAVVTVGGIVSASRTLVDKVPATAVVRRRTAVTVHFGIAVALIAVFASSVPSSIATMTDESYGREDHYKAFDVPRYNAARAVASYLDRLDLPDGAVLIDTFLGSSIVLASDHPRQFVITSDRDFEAAVADPSAFDVRFILAPPGGGLGTLDAIERRWPSLYATGANIGDLVKEFRVPNGDNVRWRLYRVRDI